MHKTNTKGEATKGEELQGAQNPIYRETDAESCGADKQLVRIIILYTIVNSYMLIIRVLGQCVQVNCTPPSF